MLLKRRVPRDSQEMVPVISHFHFGAENRFTKALEKVHPVAFCHARCIISVKGGGKHSYHRPSQVNSWMSYLQLLLFGIWIVYHGLKLSSSFQTQRIFVNIFHGKSRFTLFLHPLRHLPLPLSPSHCWLLKGWHLLVVARL